MSTPETATGEPFQLKVAYCCDHLVHPGTSQDIPNLCPSCQVKDLLNNLEKSTNQWQMYGGPDAENADIYYSYKSCRKAWQGHKLELVKYMYQLELWAEEECAWAAENPGVIESLSEEWPEVKTSEAALAVARMSRIPFGNTLQVGFVHSTQQTPRQGKKSVSFAEDIEELGPRLCTN